MSEVIKIKSIGKTINATDFSDYRSFLKSIYKLLKRSESSYSYTKLTQDLGLGQSNVMHHYITGSRPLTLKVARVIASSIGLTGPQRKYFLAQVEYQSSKKESERQDKFQKMLAAKASSLGKDMDKQSLQFFSAWYHIAIFELLRLKGAKDSPAWIAKHLKPNIGTQKVSDSLKLLEKLNLIAFDSDCQRLRPVTDQISTGSEIRGVIFRSLHHEMIQLADLSLSSDKPATRDITGVTISMPKNAWPEVKELTAQFRKQLLALSKQQDTCDQVVQINIQAFSLSKIIKDEERDLIKEIEDDQK